MRNLSNILIYDNCGLFYNYEICLRYSTMKH